MVVKPFARPFSQSITAFGASCSGSAPTVGQPCERPVPGASECTTAKPRGTHVATSEVDTFSRVGLERDRRLRRARRRRLAELLLHVPQELTVAGRAGEVRRRLVDDRDLQPFGVGLPRARDVDEHAVAPAVAVGVELGLDTERLADPELLVLEGGHDLRLAVGEHRARGLGRRLCHHTLIG